MRIAVVSDIHGNVTAFDAVLAEPATLEDFAPGAPDLAPLWDAVREIAASTRERLGEERLAWLRALPRSHSHGSLAVVHAGPASPWRAPAVEASDEELRSTYTQLRAPVTAYGHIHHPFVRHCGGVTIANTGSVSLSYDGDPRASYLLVDGMKPSIRRVEYDVDKEVRALANCRLPHADWIATILQTATPRMP